MHTHTYIHTHTHTPRGIAAVTARLPCIADSDRRLTVMKPFWINHSQTPSEFVEVALHQITQLQPPPLNRHYSTTGQFQPRRTRSAANWQMTSCSSSVVAYGTHNICWAEAETFSHQKCLQCPSSMQSLIGGRVSLGRCTWKTEDFRVRCSRCAGVAADPVRC